MNEIGITERGDAALDTNWIDWVLNKKPAILITKDPYKLNNILSHIDSHPNIIVHATITGFGGTILEPNVPDFKTSLQGYYDLIKHLGLIRVVLRVDPVIPTEKGITTAKTVITSAISYKPRIRISFIDYYNHVKQRFNDLNIKLPWDSFHAPLNLRKKAWEELGKPEICGEPDFECSGCISETDCKILGIELIKTNKNQRFTCSCLANKHELLNRRNRCSHGCEYCYWKDK